MIKAQLKKLAHEFNARLDLEEFERLYQARLEHPELKIPLGIDRYFLLSQDTEERKLAPLARQHHALELERTKAAIAAAEHELRELAAAKATVAVKKKIDVRERRRAKLLGKLDFSFDRISPLDERVFPGTFAPVIASRSGKRLLLPMRYRVRRPDGGEIPSQYNVFNARKDSLQSAATWKPLFGHRHALFPFTKFFEWVEREGRAREIAFSPSNRSMMWAAALYSNTTAKSALPYRSFAMITDEPPPEVAAAGHDRCPIFLQEDRIQDWLEPQGKVSDFLLGLLGHKEKTIYLNDLVA
ncbi:MAG: SOS response-associated peptidase family protein [Bdellovibrionota bacterium]